MFCKQLFNDITLVLEDLGVSGVRGASEELPREIKGSLYLGNINCLEDVNG